MSRFIALIVFLLSLAIGVFFLSQRVGVNPKASCSYPTYTYSKSGFTANEIVSTWVGLSNGVNEGLPSVKSSGTGTVTFKVTAKSHWPSGNVRIVAKGKNGYTSYIDWSSFSNPNCSGGTPTPNTGGGGSGNGGNSNSGSTTGQTLSFSASGFNSNETVATWVGLANGKTVPNPSTKASSAGKVTFTVTVKSDWPKGNIRVVAHGNSSKHEEYRDFNYSKAGVSGSGGSPSTASSGPSYDCPDGQKWISCWGVLDKSCYSYSGCESENFSCRSDEKIGSCPADSYCKFGFLTCSGVHSSETCYSTTSCKLSPDDSCFDDTEGECNGSGYTDPGEKDHPECEGAGGSCGGSKASCEGAGGVSLGHKDCGAEICCKHPW